MCSWLFFIFPAWRQLSNDTAMSFEVKATLTLLGCPAWLNLLEGHSRNWLPGQLQSLGNYLAEVCLRPKILVCRFLIVCSNIYSILLFFLNMIPLLFLQTLYVLNLKVKDTEIKKLICNFKFDIFWNPYIIRTRKFIIFYYVSN